MVVLGKVLTRTLFKVNQNMRNKSKEIKKGPHLPQNQVKDRNNLRTFQFRLKKLESDMILILIS